MKNVEDLVTGFRRFRSAYYGERRELVHVQTFVSQAPVKRFNEGVFHGFARSNEVELDTAVIGPIFKRPRLEFRAMIHRDRPWAWCPVQGSIEGLADRLSRHPHTGLQHRTVPTPVIDNRQDPKWPSVGQGIMHKIHTPALRRSRWRGSRSSVEGDVFPAPHAHPQLQPFQPVQSAHPLAVHEPAFATQ